VEGAADAAGEARFDGLAVGRCLFGARPPAGREGLAAETRHATLAPGEKSRQELRFEEGNPVRGRILDAETGLAVAGARVRFWWPEWEVRTLADGDFAFPPVPKRERRAWIVFVEAEGYAWTRATGRNDDPAPITVRLERGARSVVKVVDEGGRPLGARGSECTTSTSSGSRARRGGRTRTVAASSTTSPPHPPGRGS